MEKAKLTDIVLKSLEGAKSIINLDECPLYVQKKIYDYINELRNFYRPNEDHKPYLEDFKEYLVGLYDVQFKEVFETKKLNRLRKAAAFATVAAGVATIFYPICAISAIGFGLIAISSHLALYKGQRFVQLLEKECSDIKKTKAELEAMELSELEEVLNENAETIKGYITKQF